MKYWTTIDIEGHCFAEGGGCGDDTPSPKCIRNGHCPHFAYSITNDRDVAYFVPFRYLLWDRIKTWLCAIGTQLSWWFWGQLWFNQRKVRKFFDNIPGVSAKDSDVLSEWESGQGKAEVKYKEWAKTVAKYVEEE